MNARPPATPWLPKRQNLTDGLVALSLANLCFSDSWSNIVFGTPFFMPFWSWRDILAITLNICALGFLFFLAFWVSKRSQWKHLDIHGVLFLIPVVTILNLYRRVHPRQMSLLSDYRVLFATAICMAAAALFIVFRWHKSVVRALQALTLGLAILIPVNFSRAAVRLAEQEAAPPLAKPLPNKAPAKVRVVWIIFDELDWRLTFPDRPASLNLPNLDRLRTESLFGENVMQAGSDTIPAMPSLISGVKMYAVQPSGKLNLVYRTTPTGELFDWKSSPSVFREARQLGFNVGIVGWYIPYCRVFASFVSSCYWESMNTRVRSGQATLAASLRVQIRDLTPMSSRLRQRDRHAAMLAQAKEFAADPDLGFVLLHLSVPHGPALYERQSKRVTIWNFKSDWYFDNVALTDVTLGEIREAMERSGVWERTAVLVSADHGLRMTTMWHPHPDPRVPFLLKIPFQHEPYDFTPNVSAVLTKDLILSILRGRIPSAAAAADWMQEHAGKQSVGFGNPQFHSTVFAP